VNTVDTWNEGESQTFESCVIEQLGEGDGDGQTLECRLVSIDKVEFDDTIQCRTGIVESAVDDYAEVWKANRKEARYVFQSPIVLFFDGEHYWIGDGWHRLIAARRVGRAEVFSQVHRGGRNEAMKYALSANAENGLRRTNDDKRKAVRIALKEFPDYSARQIAKMVKVSNTFVSKTLKSTTALSPTETTEHAAAVEGVNVYTPPLAGGAVSPQLDSVSPTTQTIAPPSREPVVLQKKADSLIQKHVGALTRGVTDLTRLLGGEGENSYEANKALDTLLETLKAMGRGVR